MLNKIKIIGKVLPVEIKERDNEGGERNEPIFYFSVLVSNPSGALTILRFIARGEKAEEMQREIKEGEVWEIKGYLRNERSGRQLLIKAMDFTKLDIIPDKIDNTKANQVRLLGKIITDFSDQKDESKVLSFKLSVPREGNVFPVPIFFCRVHGELITKFREKLKKGDIILLEGFLQTKKIAETGMGFESGEIKFSRISSIICQAFTLIDNDSADNFNPPEELIRTVGKVEKIDFTKPKERGDWEEKETW